MQLRPYQNTCEAAVLENYSQGVFSQLVLMPTGTGKTVLFAQAPKWFPGTRTMVLVHTEELIEQAVEKIRRCNPSLVVGVEMADRFCSDDDDVVVASVPTLGRAGSVRLQRFMADDFRVIIVDEAHHAVASSYKRILAYFGFGKGATPSNRLLLGVTATSGRGDGQGLSQVFDKVTFHYSMLEAIKEGWICPPVAYRIRTDVSLDEVDTLAGDLQQNQLSQATNTAGRNELIVSRWETKGDGRTTLAFCVDIQHAQDLAGTFSRAGHRAEAIWGDDPCRAEKLRRHRDGVTTILCNCGVLVEGYDDWRIGCIILARPTKSKLLFTQMVGRGTRLQDGTGNLLEALAAGIPLLKRDCIVLDFNDRTTKHNLVSLPSLFGLPSKLELNGKTILEAVEEMQEAELLNPGMDFKDLEDIGSLDSYIEHVNLFTEEVDPIITELSKWRWCLTAVGRYVLSLERKSFVAIEQNQLGHWDIHGEVRGTEFDDYEMELGNAVVAAERLTKQFWRGSKVALRRTDFMQRSKSAPLPIEIKRLTTLCTMLGEKVPDTTGVSGFQVQVLINKLADRASRQAPHG